MDLLYFLLLGARVISPEYGFVNGQEVVHLGTFFGSRL
jgi:hypothetical protein